MWHGLMKKISSLLEMDWMQQIGFPPPLPPGTRARTPPITRGNINIWRAMIGRTLWFSTINSAETVAWSRDRQRFAVTITDAARDPATLSTEANSIKIILGSDPSSNRKIQIWQQNSHSPSSPPGSVLQY